MAYDFRSEGIRTQRLIASGTDTNDIGLLIYSSSNAADGESGMRGARSAGLTSRPSTVGKDVWMYVDGVPSNDPRFVTSWKRDQRDQQKVVLFNGDVVVSGTLYASTQVVQVDESVAGDFLVPNNLYVSGTSVFNNARRTAGDFIVRTTNRSHAIFADASTNKVGIGFGLVEYDDTMDSGPALSGTLHIAEANGRAVLVIENQSLSGSGEANDTQVSYRHGAVAAWSHGVDESDSKKFNISYGDKLGTNRVLSVVTGTSPSIVWNEDSANMDFRIESNDEAYMVFVDASTNRVSIGDSEDAPAATLEVTNHASSGATGVPLVQLNNNDTDQIGLDINLANQTGVGIDIDASNTTAPVVDITADSVTTSQVLNISADGLTTGHAIKVEDNSDSDSGRNIVAIVQSNTSATNAKALLVQSDGGDLAARIDKNASGAAAQDGTALHIDFDRTVPGSGTSAHNDIGIDLDINSRSLGTSTVKGMDVDVTGHTDGTHTATGLDVVVTGADTNEGLLLTVDDGGTDIKLMSSADTGDYFSIATTTAGATTITTVDDNAGAANLTFVVDGAVDVDANAGALSLDGSAGINIGTETDVAIDIDSSTLDIDASGAITIDGTSTLSIDSADDSNVTVTGTGKNLSLEVAGGGAQRLELNSAGTGARAIDVNATAGGLDVDINGILALDSQTRIDIGVAQDVPINMDSSTLDIDASGAITIDGTSTISIDGAGALNIDTSSGALSVGTANSGIAVNIGHSTSEVTIGDNLTVTGDLTVNGTTTTVNSTTVTVDDPIFTVGGDSAPGSDDNKDRGIEFRWHNGSAAKVGFFGFDDSTQAFNFIPDASNSSEVFGGSSGPIRVSGIQLNDDTTFISGSSGDINITPAANKDVNIPANIGMTFGDDGEKIEGDGTQLTISSGGELGLDSEGAIRLDSDSGYWHFSDAGSDALVVTASSGHVTLNNPNSDKDIIFTINDANNDEKQVMRVDGSTTSLFMSEPIYFGTVNRQIRTTGNNLHVYSAYAIDIDASQEIDLDSGAGEINLQDSGVDQLRFDLDTTEGQIDVKIMVDSDDLVFKQYDGNEVIRIADDRKLYFYDQGGEAISSDGTDMTIESGAKINLTATTDVVIPSGVGLILDGSGDEKIESDGTDISISVGTGGDINIPANIGLTFGNDGEIIEGDGSGLTAKGGTITLDSEGDITLDAGGGDIDVKYGGSSVLRFDVATSTEASIKPLEAGGDLLFETTANGSSWSELCRLDQSASSLLMAGANKLEFRNAQTAMSSSASGKLDIAALGQLLLTASTVEMKVTNAVEVKGDMNISGTLSPENLSLSNLTLASNGYLRYGDTNNYILRDGNFLKFRDADVGSVKTLADLASLSGIGPFEALSTEGPATLKIRTTGSFSLDSDNQYAEQHGDDIFMYVSGTWDAPYGYGIGDRKVSVFGGDLLVSGNVELGRKTIDVGTVYNSGKAILAVSGSGSRPMALVSGSLRFQTEGMDYLGEITPGYLTSTSESEEDIYIRNIRSSGRIVFQAGGVAAAHQIASFRGDTGALRMGTSKKIEFAGTSNHISAGGANQLAISAGTGNITTTGHIVPASNNTWDLGSEAVRFRNIYTGDLNLKNERGDWTILEEEDFLCVINNKTGKKFKMMLEPIEENE